MADAITMQGLIDANVDADTLGEAANADKIVVSRLGREYPSAPMASRIILEQGTIDAFLFLTKADLDTGNALGSDTPVTLVDGDFALVLNDETLNKNGYYKMQSGELEWLNLNASKQAMAEIEQANVLSNDITAKYIGVKAKLPYFLIGKGLSGGLNQNNALIVDTAATTKTTLIKVGGIETLTISKSLTNRFRVALFNQYPPDVGNVVFDNAAVDVATITTLSDTKCVVIFTNATTTSDDNLVVTEGVKRYNSVDERLLKIESVSIPIFTGVSDINASFFSKNIKAIKDVTMWGLAADETLSLQANWNAAVSGDGSTTSALGFLSSAGYAVAPSLPNTAPTSIYPRWTVTESIVGLKTYLLYKNADSSNPALGSVTIDWDDLEGASLFNDKTSKLKLDSDAINSVQLSYFDSKVVNPDAPVVDPNNPYFGKKIGAIGDSITWGYRPQNDPDGAAGTQLNSWLALTALELGMTATNAGISGSTLAALDATDNRQPMCRRYTSLPDDLDVICVMGGTNDVRLNIPLGVMTNRTDATYYGALHIICEGLIAKYYVNQGTAIGKTKQIVMLTPTKMLASNGALYPLLAPYALAAKEVAEYYSIPCLDLYNKSNITPHTSQTLQGTATGFLNMYNPYITDGIHPTQAGHFMMTKAVVGFLNTL